MRAPSTETIRKQSLLQPFRGTQPEDRASFYRTHSQMKQLRPEETPVQDNDYLNKRIMERCQSITRDVFK